MTIRHVPPEGTTIGTVLLERPAPAGGVTVDLEALDTSVCTVPASLFVPEAGIGAQFVITWAGEGTTQIRASHDGVERFLDVACFGVLAAYRPAVHQATVQLEPEPVLAVRADARPGATIAVELVPDPGSATADEGQKPKPKVARDLRPKPVYAGE